MEFTSNENIEMAESSCPEESSHDGPSSNSKRSSVIDIWRKREEESLERKIIPPLIGSPLWGSNPTSGVDKRRDCLTGEVKMDNKEYVTTEGGSKQNEETESSYNDNGHAHRTSKTEEAIQKASYFFADSSSYASGCNTPPVREVGKQSIASEARSPQSAAIGARDMDIISRRHLPSLEISAPAQEAIAAEQQLSDKELYSVLYPSPGTAKKEKALKRRSGILDLWNQKEKLATSPLTTRRSPSSVASSFFNMEMEAEATRIPDQTEESYSQIPVQNSESTEPLERRTFSVLERWKKGMVRTEDFSPSTSEQNSPLSKAPQSKRYTSQEVATSAAALTGRANQGSPHTSAFNKETLLAPMWSFEEIAPVAKEDTSSSLVFTRLETDDEEKHFDEDKDSEYPSTHKGSSTRGRCYAESHAKHIMNQFAITGKKSFSGREAGGNEDNESPTPRRNLEEAFATLGDKGSELQVDAETINKTISSKSVRTERTSREIDEEYLERTQVEEIVINAETRCADADHTPQPPMLRSSPVEKKNGGVLDRWINQEIYEKKQASESSKLVQDGMKPNDMGQFKKLDDSMKSDERKRLAGPFRQVPVVRDSKDDQCHEKSKHWMSQRADGSSTKPENCPRGLSRFTATQRRKIPSDSVTYLLSHPSAEDEHSIRLEYQDSILSSKSDLSATTDVSTRAMMSQKHLKENLNATRSKQSECEKISAKRSAYHNSSTEAIPSRHQPEKSQTKLTLSCQTDFSEDSNTKPIKLLCREKEPSPLIRNENRIPSHYQEEKRKPNPNCEALGISTCSSSPLAMATVAKRRAEQDKIAERKSQTQNSPQHPLVGSSGHHIPLPRNETIHENKISRTASGQVNPKVADKGVAEFAAAHYSSVFLRKGSIKMELQENTAQDERSENASKPKGTAWYAQAANLSKLRAQRRKLEKSSGIPFSRKTQHMDSTQGVPAEGKERPTSYTDRLNSEELCEDFCGSSALGSTREEALKTAALAIPTKSYEGEPSQPSLHKSGVDGISLRPHQPQDDNPASEAGQSDTLSFFTHAGSAFSGYSAHTAPSSCTSSGIVNIRHQHKDSPSHAQNLTREVLDQHTGKGLADAYMAHQNAVCAQLSETRKIAVNPDDFQGAGFRKGLASRYNVPSRFLDTDFVMNNVIPADNSTVSSAMQSSRANSTYSSDASRASFDSGSYSEAYTGIDEVYRRRISQEKQDLPKAEAILQDELSEAFEKIKKMSDNVSGSVLSLDLNQLKTGLNEGVQAASRSLRSFVDKTAFSQPEVGGLRTSSRDASSIDEGIAIEVEYISDSEDSEGGAPPSANNTAEILKRDTFLQEPVNLDVISPASDDIFSLDGTSTQSSASLIYVGQVRLNSTSH